MTHNLTLVQTEAGRSYLTEMMQGERGLCLPMRQLVMATGDVYAIVPIGTNVHRFEQVKQFEYGGLGSTVSPEEPILERMAHYTRAGPSGVLLVQDLWAKPKHYPNPRAAPSYFVNDGNIYLWAEADEEENLYRSMRLPISFHYVCYFIPDPVAAQQFRDGSRTADALAPEITEIYVPAYDEESYVIWSRKG